MKTILPGCLAVAVLLSFVLPAFSQDSGWKTNYAAALQKAQTENKAILLDFTGSDWCPWCIKMKHETLDTPMFKQYAEKNLVLVEVDFPNAKPQSETLKAQNQNLKQKFQADGFPTFVILDKSEKVLGRQVGYLAGGPAAFIAKLNTFYTPAPSSSSPGNGDDFDSFFNKPAQSPAP
jgi:protein disulfide-isomerase